MMQTLIELQRIAREDDTKRTMLLILAGGRAHNARFIDPWLGAIEFNQLPGRAVHVHELQPCETKGVFID